MVFTRIHVDFHGRTVSLPEGTSFSHASANPWHIHDTTIPPSILPQHGTAGSEALLGNVHTSDLNPLEPRTSKGDGHPGLPRTWDPLMVSFRPYKLPHIFRDSWMGVGLGSLVWGALGFHPMSLGVPENPAENSPFKPQRVRAIGSINSHWFPYNRG